MSTESYITNRKIAAIKAENRDYETMQQLTDQINQGWPEQKSLVPAVLQPYFPYRHDLTTDDELIYKAQNILIPPKLRSESLRKLHHSHQAIEKIKRLAR